MDLGIIGGADGEAAIMVSKHLSPCVWICMAVLAGVIILSIAKKKTRKEIFRTTILPVLAVCFITVGLSIVINGMPLLGVPKVDDIEKVTISWPELTSDINEYSDDKNIELAVRLTGFLVYDPLKKGQAADPSGIEIIYELKNGDSVALAANDDTVWWKGKAHSLKHKGNFAMLAKALFFEEYMTDEGLPAGSLNEEVIGEAIDQATVEYYRKNTAENAICVTSHRILAVSQEKSKDTFTVYALVMLEEYRPRLEGDFVVASGGFGTSCPAALTFSLDPENEPAIRLLEYWVPRMGRGYLEDINRKFPQAAKENLKMESELLAEMREENLAKANAAFKELTFTRESFDALIDEICSSPKTSSSPGDYINAHPNEYESLLQYGDLGLQYVFREFLEGGQTGLRGQILRCVLDDLAPEEIEKISTVSGQEYFDMWLSEAQKLRDENGPEWLEKYRPAMSLLLNTID